MNQTIISAIGWTLAILILLPHVHGWIRTNAFFGGISYSIIRQMFHLCRFTGHLLIFGIGLMSITFLVIIRILGAPIPSGIMAAMIAVSIVPFVRSLMPPAVLFFAGSSDRATSLFSKISLSVTPLRIVALLDPKRMGITGHLNRLDLMRTSNEKTWKSMVHCILGIAPVHVIDTVLRTGPVRYEANLMLTPERARHTVFICDDDGECPSLLAEDIDPKEYAIPVYRVGDMNSAVFRILKMFRWLPKREKEKYRKVNPVVAENWESMPSLLMIILAEGIDGELLIRQVRNTDKELIAFLLPFSCLNDESAKLSIDMSWDFSRDTGLVGLYLQKTGLVLVRPYFLLQNKDLLDIFVNNLSSGTMSDEDPINPEPVGVAVHELCVKLKKVAKQHNLEFRFSNK